MKQNAYGYIFDLFHGNPIVILVLAHTLKLVLTTRSCFHHLDFLNLIQYFRFLNSPSLISIRYYCQLLHFSQLFRQIYIYISGYIQMCISPKLSLHCLLYLYIGSYLCYWLYFVSYQIKIGLSVIPITIWQIQLVGRIL